MSLLSRLVAAFRRWPAREVVELTTPWVWSDAKRVLHYPECPRARNILRRNRRATGMPAAVLRDCWRGCEVCGAKLPVGAPAAIGARASSALPARVLAAWPPPPASLDAALGTGSRHGGADGRLAGESAPGGPQKAAGYCQDIRGYSPEAPKDAD